MFVALGKEFDMDCYINIKTGILKPQFKQPLGLLKETSLHEQTGRKVPRIVLTEASSLINYALPLQRLQYSLSD